MIYHNGLLSAPPWHSQLCFWSTSVFRNTRIDIAHALSDILSNFPLYSNTLVLISPSSDLHLVSCHHKLFWWENLGFRSPISCFRISSNIVYTAYSSLCFPMSLNAQDSVLKPAISRRISVEQHSLKALRLLAVAFLLADLFYCQSNVSYLVISWGIAVTLSVFQSTLRVIFHIDANMI